MSESNDTTDDALDETKVLNDSQTNAVSSNYKVLGHNQTGSGTTYGVLGQVDSSDGYGLYSPDDVKIQGTVDTATNDFVVETGTTGTTDASNVVMGHASNDVGSGATGATIAGGGQDDGSTDDSNTVFDNYGTVTGGKNNTAGDEDGDETSATAATVGGGDSNSAEGSNATVGGGGSNDATAIGATVAGGNNNSAAGINSTVAGGISNNSLRQAATVGGGDLNVADGKYATVSGGGPSDAGDPLGTRNYVYDNYGTIGGGGNNQAGSSDGTTTSAEYATVSGGKGNLADGTAATVAGGSGCDATADYAAVGGGFACDATAYAAMVPGGFSTTASGQFSFAAGRNADTNNNNGSFVWGDSTTNSVTAGTADQFVVQAGGGAKIYSASDTSNNTGVELASGSGTWSSLSTKTAKTKVRPVNPVEALEQVRSLDVTRWEYEAQADAEHMGPMAEDFYEAFGLGSDERRISTVDADGVALAAIQGVAKKHDETLDRLEAKDERIDDLEAEKASLEQELDAKDDRIDELEARIGALEDHLDLSDPSPRQAVADD
jgi:hypothetical protein